MAGESVSLSWSVLKRSIRMSYDYVGMVLATSSLWFFSAFFPFIVVSSLSKYITNPLIIAASIALTVVTFGPATAAVHGVIAEIVKGEDVRVRDFWRFWRQFFWKGLGLCLVNIGLFGIVITDIYFGLVTTNMVFRLLVGVWVYFLLFLLLLNNYTFPFLVHQQTGVLTVFKRSALLVLDNLVVTVVIGVFILLFAILNVVIAAGLILLLAGVTAFVQNVTYVELMKKYDQ